MTRRACIAALLGVPLAGCQAPWTVRRIEDVDAAGAAPDGGRFDPTAFANSIWEARVVPAARQAERFEEWRRDGMAPRLVQGTGRVVRAETARLLVDVPPYDGHADLALLTASIHGTALRDALPFIQFSQFVNQVDFAKASLALNSRAEETAQAALAAWAGAGGNSLPGVAVSFAGAGALPRGANLPEVIPVLMAFSRERS